MSTPTPREFVAAYLDERAKRPAPSDIIDIAGTVPLTVTHLRALLDDAKEKTR